MYHHICNHYGPCTWHCHHHCHCHPIYIPAPVVICPPPVIVRPRPLRKRLHTDTRLAIKALAGQRG